MYRNFINSNVKVIVSSRGEKILEYSGFFKEEDGESILLENVKINIFTPSLQKGIFGESAMNFSDGTEKVILNKKYIISCEKN